MRRNRGSASVEFVMILPIVAILLSGILYLHRAGMTGFKALHEAETATWKVAMSNEPGGCIQGKTPSPLAATSLGAAGSMAEGIAVVALSKWSFLYQNGGVRRSATHQVPRPNPPLPASWGGSDTRSDYMPCNETVGSSDGSLGPAFYPIWYKYLKP